MDEHISDPGGVLDHLGRVASETGGTSRLFWIMAAIGFTIILMMFFICPFNALNAVFVFAYCLYTGIVLYSLSK